MSLYAEKFWHRRAAFAAAKHNLAAWLTVFLRVFLGAAVAASCALLLARRMGFAVQVVWWSLAGLLAVGAIVSAFLQRRQFFSRRDAMIRLEAALSLHNGLSAALAGVADWPAPQEKTGDRLRWRWDRIFLPILGGSLVVLAAASIPLPGLSKPTEAPLQPPPAWAEVQSWIETLEKEAVAEPESLENLREQLDTLTGQDAKDWYDHASLEAGDNLHAETGQAIRDLQSNLETAAENISRMLEASDQPLTDSDLKAVSQALSGALQNLETGKLPLNKELLKQLQKMDPKALKTLDSKQLADLQQQLQQRSGACKKCLGDGPPGAMMVLQKEATLSGGKGGGGGPAPLTAKANDVNLHTKTTDSISNQDMTRALPGEVVGLSAGEHQVDSAQTTSVSGGAVNSPGQGGQAVWKDSLTPDERETLGRFFK
ncbi:MAG TPA: hypothetical protein VIT91_12345 [Chthoniobacterales bacterium]